MKLKKQGLEWFRVLFYKNVSMSKDRKTIKDIDITTELVDILDENGNATGISKSILEVHENGLWHQTAHIWVFNSKREILLQKRSKKNRYYPDLWDISAAGHTSKGEHPDKTAIRELYEEISIRANSENLKKIEVRKVSMNIPEENYYNNEFDYIYLYKFDYDISKLKLQESEVSRIKFMPIDKFESEIKNLELYKKYVPHGKYYFDVIKAIRKELARN